MNSEERLKKIFPDYFERFELPEGAREEEIKVYRACRSGKCDKASFLSSFEQNGYALAPNADPADPSEYSLSTYEKPNHVKRYCSLTSDMGIPYTIAYGVTSPKHGLAQRTKERKKKCGSHVDWWLYQDARAYEDFCVLDNFEEVLRNYLEEQEKKNGKICKD